jgi:NCAIR mutase (PurE)-related protein
MKQILERLLAGEFSVEEALRLLDAERVEAVGDLARLDPDRLRRKGVPEVIYAPGKSPEVTAELAVRMVESSGVALVSRVSVEHDAALRRVAGGMEVEVFGGGRRLRPRLSAAGASYGSTQNHAARENSVTGGRVGLIAAGTSDVDVAEEARMVADTMGAEVLHVYDVGIAAVHRLTEPLARMIAADIDALVVVAGMEGALPTLVAGLTSVPVIAVPTSSGYGAGGAGLAALLGMLQSCSPGMTVVNIDNGVGAGAAAGLIANHVAAARSGASKPATSTATRA